MPFAPSYDQELSGISVFPSLSFLFAGLLLHFVALGNVNVFLLLCHGALPVVNFWLAYLIFSRFVSKTWAALLALLGTGYFSGFHFGPAILDALQSGDWSNLNYARLPEISRFPFPGISLAFFLFAFWTTIGTSRFTRGRILGLSLLWGLQIHVYAFNFIAGAAFFALWIPYASRKHEGILDMGLIFRRWICFFAIASVCAWPFLVSLRSEVGQQMLGKMFTEATSETLVTSDWGWLVSHGLPLLLLAFTFVIFRADKHELFHRFGPVFLVLAVDLFVGSLPFLSGGLIGSELYFHRISNLFFRFLYFLPFLHFISIQRPMNRIPREEKWAILREKTSCFLHKWLHQFRVAWTSAGILLFCGFLWSNALAIQRSHEKNVVHVEKMGEVQEQLDLVQQASLPPKAIVVYQDLIPNLIGSSVTSHVSLLASVASNQLDERRILERILLHAKIFGWTTEQLAKFFEPNKAFSSYDSFKGRQLVTRNLVEPGLGNWLLNYKKQMSQKERTAQLKSIIKKYQISKIEDLLATHKVAAIVTKQDTEISGFIIKREAGSYQLLIPSNELAP